MQNLPASLARDLARRDAYPHDPGATRVEWVQTHLSHVFLTPTRVYKLRKAVSLGFVEFGTRARRNADCRAEVELNRRLAPDVYLGIAPVVRRAGRFAIGPLDPCEGKPGEGAARLRLATRETGSLASLGASRFVIDRKLGEGAARRWLATRETGSLASLGASSFVIDKPGEGAARLRLATRETGSIASGAERASYSRRALRIDATREHVVVMRRLPAGCDALSMLERGALRNRHVDAVAERLARFHAEHGLGRPSPWSRAGWLARVQAPALDNLRLLEHHAGSLFPRALLERARTRALEFASAHRDDFEARRRAGRAVDGHGDVHLAHIWFEPDHAEPTLVDCIEFNPKLRRIDAAAEVAFLAMDLAYRGRSRLAARFLASYAEAADDTHLFAVVDSFLSYRAAVRAKVAALAVDDASIPAPQRRAAAASARRHLAFAVRCLAPRPPGGLVLVAGTVGSGKSSAARVVADTLGGVLLGSDPLRKRLAGLAPTDRSAARRGLYAKAAKQAVYAALLERAEPVLRSGRIAVLDATWAKGSHRGAAMRLAERCAVSVWVVETRVPIRVALARLARRETSGDSASDAGPARLAASRAEFAPWPAIGGLERSIVRTDRAGWQRSVRTAARAWRQRWVSRR